ncbi:MAG: bifunctional diguanylate cyclase/phosphohydrolase [Armatimonadota bacterium]
MREEVYTLNNCPIPADNTFVEIQGLTTKTLCLITRHAPLILVTIFALVLTALAVAHPSRVCIILACLAWLCECLVSVYCLRDAKGKRSPLRDGAHSDDEIAAQTLQKLRLVFGVMSTVGPHARLSDVKNSIVSACSEALETDHVALFTIDACLGGIECEATDAITGALQNAFLELAGNLVTDRDCKEPWILENISGDSGSAAEAAFAECGVGTVIACPIRSEVGASGALAAFYPAGQPVKSRAYLMEAVAAQASAMISYSLAIEQSCNLLDDLAGANQELSVQATIDGLTGLANHRTFQQTLQDMCRHTSSTRSNRMFCLVMADVDHFKIYNDTHGHQAGDTVLRTVARVFSSKLRQGDLAARYGGEEFTLILKGTNKEDAQAIADRIRCTVSRQAYDRGTATVSMGIAEYPTDATDPSEIIEKADRALYHAKITGRNRIVVWGSGCAAETDETFGDTALNRERKTVLVVEDPNEEHAGDIFKTLVTQSCEVRTARTTAEAMDILRTQVFDISFVSSEVLSNRNLKALSDLTSIHPQMPVVLITQSHQLEESREALQRGASDTLLRPYNPAELPMLVERNVERCRLERERMTQKGVGLMLQSIDALVSAIDEKDHHSAGHSQRVTALALAIADELNAPAEERTALEFAARLHDIGKLALPDSALNKQSQLNEQEWAAMRQHPVTGSKIVGAIDELAYVSTIIRHHHERLNGTGYPDGLRGEAIPYPARIIAVADSYEAMTSERSYRAKLSPQEALDELKRHIGTFYVAEIVNSLGNVLIASGELSQPREQRAA